MIPNKLKKRTLHSVFYAFTSSLSIEATEFTAIKAAKSTLVAALMYEPHFQIKAVALLQFLAFVCIPYQRRLLMTVASM